MDDKEQQQQAQQAEIAMAEQGAVDAEVPAETPAGETAAVQDVVADDVAAPEPIPQPLPLPGQVLAARRQELRLSIGEVCGRMKLAPRQIIALEANDFGALPGISTVRGFVRSYAKVLGLDPAPLLAALASEPEPAVAATVARRPLSSPVFAGRRYAPPTSHRRGARRLSGLALLMLVFVGTLAFLGYRHGGWQAMSVDQLVAIAMPSQSVSAAPAPTPAAATDAPVLAVPESTADTVAVPDAASALQLGLREDTWVEIIAVDGERKLVSRLMKAGTTELVEITEPVVLVVGNAAGVDAVLRGQPLNLRAVARDNVAKLSLK